MKNIAYKVLVAGFISLLFVTPVFAEPSSEELKEDKEKVEKEIDSLQDKLSDILKKMGDLEEDLIEKGEEVIQATDDLDEAKRIEQEQYEAMKLRIKFMYEEGDEGLVESLFTSDSFTELVNKAEYVQNVHDYDRDKLAEYVETKKKVAKLKKKLEKEQAQMEELQADMEAQSENLNNLIASKENEIEDLAEQIEEAQEREAEERRQQAIANAGGDIYGGGYEYVGTGDTAVANKIIAAAQTQLGVPYVWGGTTPGRGLDCSGLTQYCHRVAGISIPRTSGPQGAGGKAVSSPKPGDIVCYPGHVGIYIGGGKMIHAPHTGDVVRVASVYGNPWYRRYW